MMDIEFVIKFGEWIRQNGYDAVKIFVWLSFFAFVIIWNASIIYKDIPEEEEDTAMEQIKTASPPTQRKEKKMYAYAVMGYSYGCWFYRVFDEQIEAVEHADRLWNQMCDQDKASYRFFCVAQLEIDDNGDFSIHGAVPIKNYKLRKSVFIKNKIKNILTFLKRKG